MGERIAVGELLDRQEEMWSRGECVPAEQLLAQHPDILANPSAVLDVIWNERRLRSETPDQELEFQRLEYQLRFPELTAALDQQFDCEAALLAIDAAIPDAEESTESDECIRHPQIPGYHQFREHDSGGFGCVYRARHALLDREVAIKVTRDDGSLTVAVVRSLHSEAARVARLRHENIVEVYEVGMCDDLPYFVMPFVEGGDLAKQIGDYKGKHELIARLLIQIAGAVHYAHSLDVLHCDINPRNVLLDRKRRPLLTDFGLAVALASADEGARPTTPGPAAALSLSSTLGTGYTREYMAPEQRSGRRADLTCQTDVYGVGAVLYHLLTERAPGDPEGRTVAPSPRATDPTIPRDLDAICKKCLCPEKDGRYGSAEAVAKDLERFLEGRPVEARPLKGAINIPTRFTKWARRAPWAASFTLAVVLGIAVAGTIQAVSAHQLARKAGELAVALDDAAETSFDLGRMAATRGSKPQAAESYRRALDLFEKLATQYPDKPSYRFQLAKTRNNLGSVLGDLGRSLEAETQFQAALGDLGVLARLPSSPPRVLEEEANVRANLGNLCLRTGRFDEAERGYTEAERIRTTLITLGGLEARFAVAKSHLDFANLYRDRSKRLPDAIGRYKKAIDEMTALIDAGLQSPEVTDRLQIATMNLAGLYLDHGQQAEADALYKSAVDRWGNLLGSDPHNNQYRRLYATVLSNSGSRHLDVGRLQNGLTLLERAEQEYKTVMREEELGAVTRGQYGVCLANLSAAHYRLSEAATSPDQVEMARRKARDVGQEAVRVLQEWRTAEPTASDPRIYQASAWTTLGNVAFAEGRTSEAKAMYEDALVLLDEVDRPTVTTRLDTLTVLNDLGRVCLDLAPPDLILAEKYFKRGVREGKVLSDENPTHSGVRSRLMALCDGLGLLSLRRFHALPPEEQARTAGQDHLRQAVEHFTEAIGYGEAASKVGIQEADHKRILIDTYARRATILERLRDLTRARADWEVVAARTDRTHPNHVLHTVAMASLQAKTDDHVKAAATLRQLGDAVTKHPHGPFNAACAYAQACLAVGKDQTIALEERRRLEGDYRQKAMGMLDIAKQGGFFQSDENRQLLSMDEDLEPIRGSAEFKTFLESLTKSPPAPDKK